MIDKSEIKHLPTVKETLFVRHYPGYFYCKELVDDSDYGGDGNLEMVCCYSDHNGQYMGDARTARYLCHKNQIREIQLAEPKDAPPSKCCSIGFREKDQRWFGWSHRAMVGFGIGDKVFEEDFGDDHTPFVQHGKVEIKNMEQAKLAAIRFAEYVS
jgi:hypothetical protein